jgi:hypothetical protein
MMLNETVTNVSKNFTNKRCEQNALLFKVKL